jgi:hypothetical protein
MNVEIRTYAQFPEKENINGIFTEVYNTYVAEQQFAFFTYIKQF